MDVIGDVNHVIYPWIDRMEALKWPSGSNNNINTNSSSNNNNSSSISNNNKLSCRRNDHVKWQMCAVNRVNTRRFAAVISDGLNGPRPGSLPRAHGILSGFLRDSLVGFIESWTEKGAPVTPGRVAARGMRGNWGVIGGYKGLCRSCNDSKGIFFCRSCCNPWFICRQPVGVS